MSDPQIIQLISALGGGLAAVAGGVFAFLKWYLPWKKSNEVKTLPEVAANIGLLYDTLQEYRGKTGAQRIFIVKAHNGGGPAKMTSPLYSSVLYEAYDETVSAMKPGWQNQPSDEEFVAATVQLHKEKRLRMDLCGLDEEGVSCLDLSRAGILTAVKKAGGTLFSDAVELHVASKGYFYLVVDMGHIPEHLPEYQNDLREVANRVRTAMWPKKG